MTLEKPIVSVIMPVFNAERFLKEAMDSILNQTFTDFEFIILNDGSTDSSLDIIYSYNDCRIKLIQNEVNMGYCAKLNEGIKIASGRYIARMDSDDISLPHRLEKQVRLLEANSQFGLCSGNSTAIDSIGMVINDKMYTTDQSPVEWQLIWTNPIVHPSVMFRTDLVKNNNFVYEATLYPAEDYDLWCRMSAVTRYSRLDDCLIKYRISSGSAYHSNFTKAVDKSIQIERRYLRTIIPEQEIPWFHESIVRFSFSGKLGSEELDLHEVILWTNKVLEIAIEKFDWTDEELRLITVNNNERYISIIKRMNLPIWEKVNLFLNKIPLNILASTLLKRLKFAN